VPLEDKQKEDEFAGLKKLINEIGWGTIEIVIKNGKPKMVRYAMKEVKLD
jgi:hypothetical protein